MTFERLEVFREKNICVALFADHLYLGISIPFCSPTRQRPTAANNIFFMEKKRNFFHHAYKSGRRGELARISYDSGLVAQISFRNFIQN